MFQTDTESRHAVAGGSPNSLGMSGVATPDGPGKTLHLGNTQGVGASKEPHDFSHLRLSWYRESRSNPNLSTSSKPEESLPSETGIGDRVKR